MPDGRLEGLLLCHRESSLNGMRQERGGCKMMPNKGNCEQNLIHKDTKMRQMNFFHAFIINHFIRSAQL